MNRALTMTALLVTLIVMTFACGGSEEAADWMVEAREAHVVADRAVERGDIETARAELSNFYFVSAPHSMNKDDVRVVRQDVCYRLARLALDASDADDAHAWANRGLNQGTNEDVFTANLYVARGQAREATGRAIDAAADYHEALKINDALLQRALDGDEQ